MRKTAPLLAALAVALAAAGSVRADDDPAKEARLLAVDGKFREVEGVLRNAPPEVQKDPALHLAIADLAMKFVKPREGEEKREGLTAARVHYATVLDLKPDEATAATGVLDAAKQLADLDMAEKKPDDARAEAKLGIEAGEKALAAGAATPQFKTLLGRLYGFRASFVKSMKDVDQLAADSTKAASLLAEASVGSEQAGPLLSEASSIRLRAANLIHEGIPQETEKRDDDALASAIDLATKACEQTGSSESDFSAHLAALRLAHSWGMKLAQKPFMQPVNPPLQPLKLEIPRAAGWTRTKSPDWDLNFDRNLHDQKNDGTVQVMIKKWSPSDTTLGKPWSSMADVSKRRFEKYKEDMGDLGACVEPVQLGNGKNALEMWHYEVAGHLKSGGRAQRIGEWIWFGDRKKENVFQLKIIDWRPVEDLEEPDIVAFVTSAIGEGVWPPGSAPKPKDDGKKTPPPKKK